MPEQSGPSKGTPHNHKTKVPGCFRCELNEDELGIHLIGETMEVREVGAGPDSPRLNRPDVAARGLGFIREAVEHGGATMDNSHLRLIVDEVFEDGEFDE